MGDCIIFCAGGFDGLIRPIAQEDYLIAADGGLRHTQRLGLTPHAVLGDFDSLGYTPAGANVFPVEKDDTDSMLAIRQGLGQGFRSFWLYGSLDGPRLDHTVANFQALQFLAAQGAWGCLVGKDTLATVIRQGCLRFPAGCQGTISVFCVGAADGFLPRSGQSGCRSLSEEHRTQPARSRTESGWRYGRHSPEPAGAELPQHASAACSLLITS